MPTNQSFLNPTQLSKKVMKLMILIYFNLENSPSSTTTLPKGKSKGLPEGVSIIYKELKKHLGKLPAIFRPDGIRKKNKTHFLDWLKKYLEEKLVKIPNFERSKFKKLNQKKCIAKPDVESNSSLLSKPAYKVYYEDSNQNKQLMKALYNTYNFPDRDILMLFLKTPLSEVYYMYLESSEFQADLQDIEDETVRKHLNEASPQDKPYILRYREVYEIFSRDFVNYYMGTGPNYRTSPTNRKPNRDNSNNQNLNARVERVEAFEIVMTDSEQGNSLYTMEENYTMTESESDSGSEFY